MNRRQVDALITVASSLLLLLGSMTEADPDTSITHFDCGTLTWPANDPYGLLVADLLGDLVAYTEQQPGYVYYIYETDPGTTVSCYAYASCNTQLSADDCYSCLEIAQDDLANNLCPFAVGAEIIMTDCHVKYDNHPFR